ncbi:serine/threonine protein kinase [Caloranaerobacter sp. TR13]|uniref:Stk1 family PASTA domain-containing Ser/Thr kinase n=1 Tax=Caloranaerobacter sp. TR13 TaxID=1302151 RepID=UPI0006D3DAA0|nr:Stk1 family PASTA domain-containing Ser/Thr kinase [Caloranaerobacter sp. TR13]KPU28268.1 serine/threonine protein kinase [Caloranaerobacter sp. TR13]
MKGRLLGDRYEIVEKIGGGGMALVYKAKCKLLNRYVAVKVLRTEFINNEEFINKFRRESQAAASLSHPNIVNIYDVGVEDDIYYIVMEYVNGKTLKELIREKGKLSYEETIDIAIQIARALSHAHKNHIVHRDIKPHNILVSDDGRVKVADFGIAKAATTSTVTNTSNVIGSVHYFSPEQARGGYTNEKSDIYSLGIVMYEMVTGRVPFEGDSPISVAIKHIQEDIVTPRQFVETIPESLEKIILKCVEKNQSLRYDSAEELLKDLEKAKESKDGSYIEINNYDDSPTRVIPAIKDDMLMNKRNNDKKKSKKNKNKNKSNKVITFFAILLALIFTTALAVGFLYIKDYLFVEEVNVPLIIGLHEDVAKQKIESLGLKFVVKKRIYNKDYKEGYIISQNIDPKDKVKIGYPIEVVVSKGEKLVRVPDLLNKYSSDIEVALSEVGLRKGNIDYKFSDIYPEGIVISQKPEPLSMVPEGTEIDFVISQGPEISYVIMPNLIGLNLENAKREIISKGFVLGEVKYEPNNDIPKDLVTWQSYPAGAEVEENTTVDLIISSGPITVGQNDNNLIENNEGKNEQDQITQNEQDTLQEQEKVLQLIIPLPQDREKVEVKIYKIQGQSKEIIYNKIHETKEERISVTISGKGEVKYEIYYDGEFYEQKVINF